MKKLIVYSVKKVVTNNKYDIQLKLIILFIILGIISSCASINNTIITPTKQPIEPNDTIIPLLTKTITKELSEYTPTFQFTSTIPQTTIPHNWILRGLINTVLTSLIIDPKEPKILYAAADGIIYKSVDGGIDWHQISEYITASYIAIDPNNSSTIYVSARDWIEGLIRGYSWAIVLISLNGGGGWISSGHIVDRNIITCVSIDPINSNILYIGMRGLPSDLPYSGIYKSIDGGITWVQILGSIDVFDIVIDPNASGILYAGTMDNGIIKTTDGGKNWVNIYKENTILAVGLSPDNTKIIYAATNKGIIKSENSGKDWMEKSIGLIKESFFIHTIKIDPTIPNIIYLGTSKGVYKSISGGEFWFYDGLENLIVTTIALDSITPTKIYLGTNKGVYLSS